MKQRDDCLQRFLRYVKIDTRSVMAKAGEKPKHPSSEGQIVLGNMIKDEIFDLGVELEQFFFFRDSSFLVHFPATPGYENAPHSVYSAHLDTYYNVSGVVHPRFLKHRGGRVILGQSGLSISAEDLAGLEKKHLVVTDGTSLLGADNKAGVAIMVTVIEKLLSGKFAHGPISFWFCVDEEIGELDINVVPEAIVKTWDILWTLDSERGGPIDVGCFCSRKTYVTFHGEDSHTGLQGDKIRPAHYAACIFVAKLADLPTPVETTGHEGFFYANSISESIAEKAVVQCAPRAFEMKELDEQLATIKRLAEESAKRFGCTVEFHDEILYLNTRKCIEAHMDLVQPGIEAHRKFWGEPELRDVRCGTDGAMINKSYPNIPAPNIGTGTKNLHGKKEFLVVEEMETVPKIVLEMIERYAKMKK